MPNINDYLKYAETAFAAYASNLTQGKGNTLKYEEANMTTSQAQHFDAGWQVLGQQDLSDGFSAVLLQSVDVLGNPAGQKVLAIRGTEGSHWGMDFFADAINIGLLGTSAGMLQYASLENFYQTLMVQGKLGATEGFVTTGHSLGGFLAQAFTAKHSQVSAAYTYNAPGFSVAPGVVSNLGTELLKLFGLSGTIPNDKIFNMRAYDGISATAGLGQMIGAVQTVNIEATINPVTNHSIATLTDALAVYSAYSGLAPALSSEQIGALLKASGVSGNSMLENALDALRATLVDGNIAVTAGQQTSTDRDNLYTNLYVLQASTAYKNLVNTATLAPLAGAGGGTLVSAAKTDFGRFFALKYMLPFALDGARETLNK